ncbi:hypothetical protein Bbelb_172820 [Branchiostoma belcheri]|nr:hypothetical protein Bbelb_172820 [Branchiostoma belcheri]
MVGVGVKCAPSCSGHGLGEPAERLPKPRRSGGKRLLSLSSRQEMFYLLFLFVGGWEDILLGPLRPHGSSYKVVAIVTHKRHSLQSPSRRVVPNVCWGLGETRGEVYNPNPAAGTINLFLANQISLISKQIRSSEHRRPSIVRRRWSEEIARALPHTRAADQHRPHLH